MLPYEKKSILRTFRAAIRLNHMPNGSPALEKHMGPFHSVSILTQDNLPSLSVSSSRQTDITQT
jgi:hypothetical protein